MSSPAAPSTSMIEHNLLARDAIADWKAYGQPLLLRLLEEAKIAGHGRASVKVPRCHDRKPARCEYPVRVRRVVPASRLVELCVTPFDSHYYFDVNVSVARGLALDATLEDIKKGCELIAVSADLPPAKPKPEPAVPLPSTVQVERLEKMRDGITLLLDRGRQLAELTAERDKAAAELAKLDADTNDLQVRFGVATDHTSAVAGQLKKLREEAADLAAQLAKITKAADAAAVSLKDAEGKESKLAAEWEPHGQRRARLLESVATADQLIGEQQKAMSKAGDMSVLLAALERLG